MTVYSAPLADIEFVLNSYVDLQAIMDYSYFDGADHAMVSDLLSEAARFMGEKFAPLIPTARPGRDSLISNNTAITMHVAMTINHDVRNCDERRAKERGI